MNNKPNVLFVFADQWRYQAFGYSGDPNVKTPNIDAFSRESINISNAVSGCPVCTPYRASLMTGQFPHSHGAFLNDVHPRISGPTIAESFRAGGWDTAYVGKWHLDGGETRSSYIPPERRMGFDYWKVLECSHDYNTSLYYEDSIIEKKMWEGYDAFAQTEDILSYIGERDGEKPFFAMLSWGPPHAPYETAPDEFRELYDPSALELRPNVHPDVEKEAREDLAGYYAHCTALDACWGRIIERLKELGLYENTILVFTSDHGDMLGSQGLTKKQKPWEESIRVPFLLSYPRMENWNSRELKNTFLDAQDVMPTLLKLCDLEIPDHCEGIDYSAVLKNKESFSDGVGIYCNYQPFTQWPRDGQGGPLGYTGREARGIVDGRYTYVEDKSGPWLLYDKRTDPYQMSNLIDIPEYKDIRNKLAQILKDKLSQRNDQFLYGLEYARKWGYELDHEGAMPWKW